MFGFKYADVACACLCFAAASACARLVGWALDGRARGAGAGAGNVGVDSAGSIWAARGLADVSLRGVRAASDGISDGRVAASAVGASASDPPAG